MMIPTKMMSYMLGSKKDLLGVENGLLLHDDHYYFES